MLSKSFYKKLNYLIHIVLLLLLFLSHARVSRLSRTKRELISDKMELLDFNKNISKKSHLVISELTKENDALKNKLKDPEIVEKIKYIVKTKYKTNLEYIILDEVPSHYLYEDSNKIPICLFEYDGKVKFSTLPVSYDITTIVFDNHNYTYLQVTDYKNKEYKIELKKEQLESQVIKVKPKEKLFDPSIYVGLNLSYSNSIELNPTITLNLFNQGKHNFISPSYLFQENAIGLELYSYNIGSEDRIIKNTNLGLTVYQNIRTYYGINLTTRF